MSLAMLYLRALGAASAAALLLLRETRRHCTVTDVKRSTIYNCTSIVFDLEDFTCLRLAVARVHASAYTLLYTVELAWCHTLVPPDCIAPHTLS